MRKQLTALFGTTWGTAVFAWYVTGGLDFEVAGLSAEQLTGLAVGVLTVFAGMKATSKGGRRRRVKAT